MFDYIEIGRVETDMQQFENIPYIPDAGECMRCGLCVSSCPTFRLFQINEETPRQRIRSISKILIENQSPTAEELKHLDNCLQCRACESICPSQMNYGALFDQTQMKLNANRQQSWLKNLGFRLIEHKRLRNLLLPFVLLYLYSGLQKPLRSSGWLKKLNLAAAESLLSKPTLVGLAGIYPSKKQKQRGRVALFTGCLAEHFDRDTQHAAIKVLNTIGFEVVIPEEQVCCGAIHQHNGRSAQEMIEKNIKVFYALEVEAVIYTASGCGAMLAEYSSQNTETSDWFRNHVQDINEFLLKHWPAGLQPAASNLNVAVHEPCTQRNVLKNAKTVYALLEKIPGLNVQPLVDNQFCCGAGGSYMLSHPDNAAQLNQLKWQAIESSGADLVVSCNFGCAFYLNTPTSNVNQPVYSPQLMHSVRLLADRL